MCVITDYVYIIETKTYCTQLENIKVFVSTARHAVDPTFDVATHLNAALIVSALLPHKGLIAGDKSVQF